MGKVIRLNKEDSKVYREQGYYYIDKYIIVMDQNTGLFEYGVAPSEIEYYDPIDDEVEFLFLDEEETVIEDCYDYDEVEYDE